jgi:hypothetical protein
LGRREKQHSPAGTPMRLSGVWVVGGRRSPSTFAGTHHPNRLGHSGCHLCAALRPASGAPVRGARLGGEAAPLPRRPSRRRSRRRHWPRHNVVGTDAELAARYWLLVPTLGGSARRRSRPTLRPWAVRGEISGRHGSRRAASAVLGQRLPVMLTCCRTLLSSWGRFSSLAVPCAPGCAPMRGLDG